MKIPLDYFLYTIKNFLAEIGLKDVTKALSNHIEIPEQEFKDLMGEMKESSSLKDIFKFYCSSHPEIAKFWKSKSKELAKKYEIEQVDKEEEVKNKKSNGKAEEKLLNKKKQRVETSSESEEEEEEIVVKKVKTEKIKVTEQNNNQNSYTPIANKEKTPFKRIDDSLKDVLPMTLRDNSYESFMNKTGDEYGREANEKLRVTKGRDFRKEKTKYKNKVGSGGSMISTQVRSIPLDVDSD